MPKPKGAMLQTSPKPYQVVGLEYDQWPHGRQREVYRVVVDINHYRRVVRQIKRGGGTLQQMDARLFAAFQPKGE